MDEDKYDFNIDTVENYESLNNIYKDSYDWIKNADFIDYNTAKNYETNKLTKESNSDVDPDKAEINYLDLKPDEAFKLLTSIPNERYENNFAVHNEYSSRMVDPLARLMGLRHELAECKKEIDLYVDNYNDNSYLINSQNISNIYDDIKLYKTKLDSFVNYKVFEDRNSYEDLNCNDNNKANNNLSHSKSSTNNNNYNSLSKRNDILANDLLSKIKIMEEQMLTSKDNKDSIEYQIIASPEEEIETLETKLNELDSEISNLENTIGEWSLYDNGESICVTLNKLINFIFSMANVSYEKKYTNSRDFGNMISNFMEQKKDQIYNGSYFIKIKELYTMLELCENFDQVFEYLKKRIETIASIHQQSNHYSSIISNIKTALDTTEKKYKSLVIVYDETIKALEEYQKVLIEVEKLDKEFKEIQSIK